MSERWRGGSLPDSDIIARPEYGQTLMHHPTVNIALKAARSAGKIILRAMDRLDRLVIEEKGQNDFVTDVDRQVEQELIHHINKAFPDHAILGEEGGYSIGDVFHLSASFIFGNHNYNLELILRWWIGSGDAKNF